MDIKNDCKKYICENVLPKIAELYTQIYFALDSRNIYASDKKDIVEKSSMEIKELIDSYIDTQADAITLMVSDK